MNNFELFENFNSLNETELHAEPHDIFVKYVRFDGCSSINGMAVEEQCAFAQKEPSCAAIKRYLNYIKFIFCIVETGRSSLLDAICIFLLAFLAFYYFHIMGVIAGKFFIPSLNYVTKTFRMSQSLAGATILAMANSIGGFFLSFSNMMADFQGMFSATFGSVLFQLTLVAGIVTIIQPFHLYLPIFARDSVFLMTITTYIAYIMKDERVNPYESAVLLFYYALFIFVVVIDTNLIRKMSKDIRRKIKLLEAGEADDDLKQELALLENEGVMEILAKDSKSILDVNTTKSALFHGKSANEQLFRQFVETINPVELEEWKTSGCFIKAMLVMRVPFVLLFLLVCPRVNFNLHNHGWSKLLNVFHLWSGPQFIILMSRMRKMWLYDLHISIYSTCISLPLMVIVFFTSRTDVAPVYHLGFAFWTVFMGILMMRMVALEIISVTSTIGVISRMSPSLVAATLTSWEGGLGALIANVTLALRGYPRMAFSACYGGPLLSIPITFGVRLVYKSFHSPGKIAVVHRGPLAGTLYAFVLGIVFFSLLGVILAKNKARRSIGIWRVLLYPLFLLYALLVEFEITHGHSTDHTDQRVRMD